MSTTPTPVRSGLDPQISLATSMHAEPGVYALLLGSGVSSAAGIPTGWQIVTDLVRKVATVKDGAAPSADFDAGTWWEAHGDGELGYSSLLHTLGATPAARDGLLRGYFEASDDDKEQGLKVPTPAHHAIAELVARGSIKVVLTTNFDRLLEQALEQRGIQPQVIHRAEQVAAMTPLAHAPITIIKLHGDFRDLDKRNTIDELSSYPEDLAGLLRSVLDNYGLLISGWSGEWDVALVAALEEIKQRRYPLYWAARGTLSNEAAKLAAQLGAVAVPGVTADALFTRLLDQLAALDSLKAAPLTRELAVTQLKRFLPDPVKRIELDDLVTRELKTVEAALNDPSRFPVYIPGLSDEDFCVRYEAILADARAQSDTLLHLVAQGAYHGGPEQHAVWTKVVQRLMTPRTRFLEGTHQQVLVSALLYPGLLVVTTMFAAARLAGRGEELVQPLLLKPALRLQTDIKEYPAAHHLHAWRLFPNDTANKLPRWAAEGQNNKWLWPVSEILRRELLVILQELEPSNERCYEALDWAEMLIAFAQQSQGDHPAMARFVLAQRHSESPMPALVELRQKARSAPLADLFPEAQTAGEVCDKFEAEVIRSASRSW